MRILIPLLALLIGATGPALAQETDAQTGDYAEQDRRYYERFVRPEEQQEEEVPADPVAQAEAYLAQADELIRDPNYRSAVGDRYRVQTDDPDLDPKAAVSLLEAFRDFFDEYWQGRTELAPYDKESRVFLFFSFYKYNQLLGGNWRFRETRPAGHYRPAFDVITLHTDADGRDNVADTLVHEAAHQMIEQRIFGHGHPAALWVTEGLATYFGYTYMDPEGAFHAGEVGGKADSLMRGKPRPSAGEGRAALRNARKAMKAPQAEDGLIFAGVISITDPGIFYGEAAGSHYAASWLVVHFLMHGDEGQHQEGFIRYLEKVARGEMDEESLFSAVRMSRRGLEDAVTAHAKKIKAR
jgi:hypothetical protein